MVNKLLRALDGASAWLQLAHKEVLSHREAMKLKNSSVVHGSEVR